jgi:hypothetical protein
MFRIRIRDPDPGGQKLPRKIEKSKEVSCFEVLDIFDPGSGMEKIRIRDSE